MKLVKVKEKDIPCRMNHNLNGMLTEFMNMDIAYVEIDLTEHEYKNVKSAYMSIRMAIKRLGYPIKCTTKKGTLYLIRIDM